MSSTTNLSTLKINYLTDEQYQAALSSNLLNENELYLTPINTLTSEEILAAAASGWGVSAVI